MSGVNLHVFVVYPPWLHNSTGSISFKATGHRTPVVLMQVITKMWSFSLADRVCINSALFVLTPLGGRKTYKCSRAFNT